MERWQENRPARSRVQLLPHQVVQPRSARRIPAASGERDTVSQLHIWNSGIKRPPSALNLKSCENVPVRLLHSPTTNDVGSGAVWAQKFMSQMHRICSQWVLIPTDTGGPILDKVALLRFQVLPWASSQKFTVVPVWFKSVFCWLLWIRHIFKSCSLWRSKMRFCLVELCGAAKQTDWTSVCSSASIFVVLGAHHVAVWPEKTLGWRFQERFLEGILNNSSKKNHSTEPVFLGIFGVCWCFFFPQPEYQVITVGWEKGAKFLVPSLKRYENAVSNSRVVGALIAQLLNSIHHVTRYPMRKVHCIGHSLGAHACGFAGKRLTGNMTLGRITGKCILGKLKLHEIFSGKRHPLSLSSWMQTCDSIFSWILPLSAEHFKMPCSPSTLCLNW